MASTFSTASLLFALRVGAALALLSATPARAISDHLQCYQVTDTALRNLKGIVDLEAPPADPSEDCRVGPARFYCVPATKTLQSGTLFNGRQPIAPFVHVGPPADFPRVCYKLQCRNSEELPPVTTVADQFGTHAMTRLASRLLCTPARVGTTRCGNGTRDGGEPCEGSDLGGATCQTLGFLTGSLACTSWCTHDTSGCTASFPATGQVTCWDTSGAAIACAGTGHDGDIQAGETLAYVDNGDGTITDVNTGLMWEKLSDDGGIHDWDTTYTWPNSFTKAAALNSMAFAGHTDWRVPNVKELVSITNYEFPDPSVSPAFHTPCTPGCANTTCSCTKSLPITGYYWTSTTNAASITHAFGVYSYGGLVNGSVKQPFATFYVRAVRGSSSLPRTGQRTCWNETPVVISCAGSGHDGETRAGLSLAHVDNDDGTVTDLRTGLTWEKLSDDGSIHDQDDFYTWDDALAVKIAALNSASFAGHADWRLPSVKELQSIVDYGSANPAITPAFDTECPPGCASTTCSCTPNTHVYWSSTTTAGDPQSAWFLTIGDGKVEPTPKTLTYNVRAVRGGS
jgi:hypothetical protein